MVYFHHFLLSGFKLNCLVNLENGFCVFLMMMYICLNVKPLKKCIYFLY